MSWMWGIWNQSMFSSIGLYGLNTFIDHTLTSQACGELQTRNKNLFSRFDITMSDELTIEAWRFLLWIQQTDMKWYGSSYIMRVLHVHSVLIYLFIYCHLYSAFSIVQCSNVLYRLWDGEIQGHTGQTSVWEIDAHTMYNQWATALGRRHKRWTVHYVTRTCWSISWIIVVFGWQ